jgi:hypothetical protein
MTDERKWELTEPVEVRMQLGTGGKVKVLTASARNGLVVHSLNNGVGGPPESLSNLQVRRGGKTVLFPTKAVKGWQDEVVAFVANSLYTVTEVR